MRISDWSSDVCSSDLEITEETLEAFRKAGIDGVGTIWVNDLDRGAYLSNTLRIDSTKTQLAALVEIYRMMRPGEPPTKDAAQNLFHTLFFTFARYDLTTVGRMKRSVEHTTELQSLMSIQIANFCLKKQQQDTDTA